MPATLTVDLTEEQEAYARSLVEAGAFPSVDAVLHHSLDKLRLDEERNRYHGMTQDELRALLEERRKGPFISMEESDRRMKAMFARKRREHGLSD